MSPQVDVASPNGDTSTTRVMAVEPCAEEMSEEDHHRSVRSRHSDDRSRRRERARDFARKAKGKAKDFFNVDDKESTEHGAAAAQKDALDTISSDPAFNPSLILNQGPPKPSKFECFSIKSELKAAANTIAHPGQTIRDKATRSAAGKISRAQRPFLSAEQDRNLLAAHEELGKVASSRSSMHFGTPTESTAETSGEEDAARRKLEQLEEQRLGLHVAWALGKHVDRVKIVQARVPEPLSWDNFVEKNSSGEPGRFQWERWLGYQALYHTRGFTARYIDDFEELPFDMEDLSRIVERLVLVSTSWQVWFMSVRHVYTWEDPRRTGKWLALFCILWYTNHIMGFVYAFIIHTVIRNKYHPGSVESIRQSMKRGVDHEAKAQAWGELVEQHGSKDWIEPLLDEVGPYIQLQLGDLTDLLEVLANFYRWKSPRKTAETVFFFCCCLLVTLLTDMAFCMKIIWLVVGGWFFLCFPIASRYPKYRHLMDPAKWILWDIPTNAEWSIEFLQRKASAQQKQTGRRERVSHTVNFTDSEISSSDYETAPSTPQRGTSDAEEARHHADVFKFRAWQAKSRGHIMISRSGIRFSSRSRSWAITYSQLIEMCKAKPASTVKTLTFGVGGSCLQFFATDAQGAGLNETITVHEDQRDEMFNLVLGWSGLRWRAICIERPRPETSTGKRKK